MLKLAVIGMVDGNAHPYSWSAIINGYDPDEMSKISPEYKAIPEYLSNQPDHAFPIPDVRVTHIWVDSPYDAHHIARSSLIPNVLKHPEDAIGQVDAVIVATDIGSEHVERCKPFVEVGLPVFVDKPLVDNEHDLKIFTSWVQEGKPILSSSCMRYAKEFSPYRSSTNNLGEIKFASITTPKTWERYGIHAMEAIYPILGPGFISARNTGTWEQNVVHFKHKNGADVIVVASQKMFGGFGLLTLCGTKGSATTQFADSFFSFKTQLLDFIRFVQTGIRPFEFVETVELMKMLIAAKTSREQDAREIRIDEIKC